MVDVMMLHYGQPALIGFDFGTEGLLRRIAASFSFEVEGKRLGRGDIIRISKRLASELKRNYGRPVVEIPWDGSALVYIWLRPADIIQLGWNGGDAWGVHYRSRLHDPEMPAILEFLRSQGVTTG